MRCGGREDFVVVGRGEENCEIPELVLFFLRRTFEFVAPRRHFLGGSTW